MCLVHAPCIACIYRTYGLSSIRRASEEEAEAKKISSFMATCIYIISHFAGWLCVSVLCLFAHLQFKEANKQAPMSMSRFGVYNAGNESCVQQQYNILFARSLHRLITINNYIFIRHINSLELSSVSLVSACSLLRHVPQVRKRNTK